MFPQRAEIKEKSEPIIGSRRKFLIIIGFSNELKEKIIAHYACNCKVIFWLFCLSQIVIKKILKGTEQLKKKWEGEQIGEIASCQQWAGQR
jgi:hypothetical protein